MAGAASAIFLLDIKGHVLIWRDYRGDVSSAQAERFFTKHLEKEVPVDASMCVSVCGVFICVYICISFMEFELENWLVFCARITIQLSN